MQTRDFSGRLRTMLRVDLRRMFTMPLFYILLLVCLAAPVLVLVMTTMLDGTVTVDPQTGVETVMEGFTSVWQFIGSTGAASAEAAQAAGMGLTDMCNINLLYFALAALVCLFTAEDFRSGYAKNLFAVRAKKGDYVASKILVCSLCGLFLLAAALVGTLIGGQIAGLPFALEGAGPLNLLCCLLSKAALIAVFVPLFVLAGTVGKGRLWLSLPLALFAGMLLFMTVPLMTPLNAGPMHVLLCLAGGALFSVTLGIAGKIVLSRTDIV